MVWLVTIIFEGSKLSDTLPLFL